MVMGSAECSLCFSQPAFAEMSAVSNGCHRLDGGETLADADAAFALPDTVGGQRFGEG